jgi:hypothetical protein
MIHYLLWQTTLHLLVNFSNGQKLIVWVFGHKNLFLILFFYLKIPLKNTLTLREEEGWVSGHILNITNEIISMVTPLTFLSVPMPHHRMVWLFESHCNSIGNCVCKNLHTITLFDFFYSFYFDCDSLGIYQRYISVGVYR